MIYDDDHYYMGGALAERCRQQGLPVSLVTPDSTISSWTCNTLEQEKIQARLLSLDVELIVSHQLSNVSEGIATVANVYDQNRQTGIPFDTLIMVTSREPNNAVYLELSEQADRFKTLLSIGDSLAPGTIAAAVYDGHLAARNLESEVDFYEPLFRREMPELG